MSSAMRIIHCDPVSRAMKRRGVGQELRTQKICPSSSMRTRRNQLQKQEQGRRARDWNRNWQDLLTSMVQALPTSPPCQHLLNLTTTDPSPFMRTKLTLTVIPHRGLPTTLFLPGRRCRRYSVRTRQRIVQFKGRHRHSKSRYYPYRGSHHSTSHRHGGTPD